MACHQTPDSRRPDRVGLGNCNLAFSFIPHRQFGFYLFSWIGGWSAELKKYLVAKCPGKAFNEQW